MGNSPHSPYFEAYVEGWDRLDIQAVAAQFAPGGTYTDPVVGGPVAGGRIEAYFAETVEAFPDLDFEGRTIEGRPDGVIVNQWTGTGTHSGWYFGVPPTGNRLSLDGVSVFTIGAAGIGRVESYFDRSTVKEQLGLTFPDVLLQAPRLGYEAVASVVGDGN